MIKFFCEYCQKEISPADIKYLLGWVIINRTSMVQNTKGIFIQQPGTKAPLFIEERIEKQIFLCQNCLRKIEEFLQQKK